jgi:hypothetical protein
MKSSTNSPLIDVTGFPPRTEVEDPYTGKDDPDQATKALQRAQREKLFREVIKGMEFFYDWLDSGAINYAKFYSLFT